MSKIIGVTVGTPISARKIDEELKPVKTVNGKAPDENGNVDTGDPTVPAWAKQPNKPTYTAEEVGAIPAPATASVGQTIKVSAVDDSGKPTAWEAVDLPGTWELVSEGETLASDNIAELSTGDIECRKLLFVVKTAYGQNVTATVKVNGVTFHTGWYQFQHVSANQTNTVIVEKISNEFIGYKMRGMTLKNGEVFKLDGWTYITADKLNITFALGSTLSTDSSYKIYRQV